MMGGWAELKDGRTDGWKDGRGGGVKAERCTCIVPLEYLHNRTVQVETHRLLEFLSHAGAHLSVGAEMRPHGVPHAPPCALSFRQWRMASKFAAPPSLLRAIDTP
jgi:hypothetical protein